jgi:polyisoprenoid-binding protein YceI
MSHLTFRRLAPVAALVLALPAFAADTFQIDPMHSETGFQIRHVVTKVRGRFAKFSGTILYDQVNPAKSSVDVSIDAASITTDTEMRDKDLRSEKFFDVAKFPTLTFKSTGVKRVNPNQLEVTGTFTLHGVTRTITIPVTELGVAPGMAPNTTVAGFEGKLTIKRSDYGITTYVPVVGDEVEISLNVEALKK